MLHFKSLDNKQVGIVNNKEHNIILQRYTVIVTIERQ